MVYQGVRRLHGTKSTPKLSLTVEMLLAFVEFLDFSDPNAIMWWAASLTSFFGILRKDNVTVLKSDSFNSRNNLTRGDFSLDEANNNIVWVRIKHSKTNQVKAHTQLLPLKRIASSILSPVNAIEKAFKLLPQSLPDSAG
jgi:hypothetical protein